MLIHDDTTTTPPSASDTYIQVQRMFNTDEFDEFYEVVLTNVRQQVSNGAIVGIGGCLNLNVC